jgi:membrane protease YdiL (CAAX protease family)
MTDPTNLSPNEPPDPQAEPPNQAPLAPAKHFTLRSIFVGADGLRAGWSLLIFIALMAAVLKGVSVLGNLLHLFPKPGVGSGEIPIAFAFVGESIPLLATLLITWIMSRIEKRPNSVYGLGGQRTLPNFLAGLGWGVVCLSLLVLILWRAGLLVFDSRLLFGGNALRYGALWLLGFFVVALLEEYLGRGYVLFTLTRGFAGIYAWLFKIRNAKMFGFWTGALLLSLLFGLGHGKNPGESPIGLVSAGLVGLIFCLSLWRTGSLWWAIGFHAAWDWAQSFLYGVADSGVMVQHHLLATHPVGKPLLSGGTTGPEGSIFVLPLLALLCLIIIFTLPRAAYGDTRPRTPSHSSFE